MYDGTCTPSRDSGRRDESGIARANPRKESSDKTKRRVLTADDSLWALAHREYGDVAYWRLIARQNRIENPRLVEAGTALELPPLDPDDRSAVT